MTHFAVTTGVDNRNGEDTAQSDAEAEVRRAFDSTEGAYIRGVSHSETVGRPSFMDGDTYWTIQVTVNASVDDDAVERLLDHSAVETLEEVAMEVDA